MSLTIVWRSLLVLCAVGAVWILPAAAWQGASLDGLLNATTLPQHRSVSHLRVGDRDRRAGLAGARSPLHDLRRDAHRRALEDDQQRRHVGPDLRQRRSRRGRCRRRRALQPGDRLDGHRRSGERALVVLGQGRLQVHRRRQDLAARWACPTRITSRASSSIRPTRRSSTSRRWATSSRGTRSAACSGRATAARRGTRCSMSTTAPARSIS